MWGIVAIGRNEGERLRLCLESLSSFEVPTVYVDSDSTDSSVPTALSYGVAVLQLDPSEPMSAARARREGFRQLLHNHPDLEYVLFVDGDCQLAPQWPQHALAFLEEHRDVGAVCGRRRELHPENSVFNRICDQEWDTPVGEAMAVGGDAFFRCEAYQQAGEFDPTVPAGEEPELCKRLRDHGWKIWRLDAEMTTHDAAMTRFGQWWRRQFRTGYAGLNVERRFQLGLFSRILKSALIWGLVLPGVALFSAFTLYLLSYPGTAVLVIIVAMSLFMLQLLRISLRNCKTGGSLWHALQYGFFTMASKLPIALGALRQWLEAAMGKQAQLVEYKSAAASSSITSAAPKFRASSTQKELR